jgi:guanosine-3',5'-bis(diphosphate) 3'-pyrophosphohydrolase
VLHDTIEDTETTADELRALFGDQVASVVLEVTDDKSLDKAQRKQLQIEHAAHCSPQAKLVKLADKTCNVRDMASHAPHGWPLERRREHPGLRRHPADRNHPRQQQRVLDTHHHRACRRRSSAVCRRGRQ